MEENNIIFWSGFYKELSEKLLEYKNKRNKLFDLVQEVYKDANVKPFNLTGTKDFKDIDPFTFFALFNQFNQTFENKVKLIESVKKVLNLDSEIPNTYTGIPLIIPLRTRFYYIKGDCINDINILWKLFESALILRRDRNKESQKEFIKYFDQALNINGVGLSKLTMGLFWIDPDFFIALDHNNLDLIYHSDIFQTNLVKSLPSKYDQINGEVYLKILEQFHKALNSNLIPYNNIIEFSDNAWNLKLENKNSTRENSGSSIGDEGIDTVHYWTYSPGPHALKWDEFFNQGILAIGWGEIGDLNAYETKNDIRQVMRDKLDSSLPYKLPAHAAWQFVHEMNPGDVVFAKNGMNEVIGKGIVTSDYEFNPEVEDEYKNIRHIDWTHKGHWEINEKLARKTLTDITDYTSLVDKINSLFEESEDSESKEINYPEYSKDAFLDEVYLTDDEYNELKRLLRMDKNLILNGAPGTGKTFASKRLAYSLMGEKNSDRVYFIQFHQSYSYEDFIMGFRPDVNGSGFILRNGPFYEFCKRAEIDSDNDYFFIIDEINRGNLSKIFGELFTLLEKDKRDVSIDLLYSDEKFSIPDNVYLIGMMNTADRSLALMDYALRRRFSFFEFSPAFDSEGFKKYQEELENDKFDSLIEAIKLLNKTIIEDDSLGKGFQIGHSYFCSLDNYENLEEVLNDIVTFKIIPLLEEYWYDEPSKVLEWQNRLKEAIS